MIITRNTRENLLCVRMSEKEIDSILYYIDLDLYGIELLDGENLLNRDTLWFILCELNNKKDRPNDHSLEVINTLKSLLYPSIEEWT